MPHTQFGADTTITSLHPVVIFDTVNSTLSLISISDIVLPDTVYPPDTDTLSVETKVIIYVNRSAEQSAVYVNSGVSFTVTTKSTACPVHPSKDGITEYVTVPETAVVDNISTGISPVPFAVKPVTSEEEAVQL